MEILLLSPYDAASHRYWREGLTAMLDEHRFTTVTLPARHFSWRSRGNSLTLAHDERINDDADVIIATSMTDLSALRGMRPRLANIPAIVYFHENQFAYPDTTPQDHQIERQITSIYTAISADSLVFNSQFNRDTFLEGTGRLLSHLPDHVPPGIVERLAAMSLVLPVALDDACLASDATRGKRAGDKFSIVWNHRWEHDKGLLLLQELIFGLIKSGQDFEFHLVGQQFRNIHPIMQENIRLLEQSGHLGQLGFLDSRQAYLALLASSHCVLSTSRHEFQGLAVQEAMALGCIPVVPDDLAYPEYVPPAWRYKHADEALALIGRAQDAGPIDISLLPRRQAIESGWRRLLTQLDA